MYERWYIDDDDFERSLTENEMKHVHNLWMNDVKEWMSDDCYQLYTDLLKSAADLKSQGRDECKSKKGHGKGPGQQAQQLKKQRFDKVQSDLGAKNNFVLAFVRHLSILTPQGIRHIFPVLHDE